jgi:hypothetical protein
VLGLGPMHLFHVVRVRVSVRDRVRVCSHLSLLAALVRLLRSLPFADCVSAMLPKVIQAKIR